MARRRSRSGTLGRRLRRLLMVALVGALVYLWDLWQTPVGSPDREAGGFTVMEAVRLLEDGVNDGDSFWIRHQGGKHLFRLYFVDTCETNARYPDRLRDQGVYFGGLSQAEVLRLGAEAKAVVMDWLRHEPFQVFTRHERVMGGHRVHAMIWFPGVDGRGGWLSQRLVASGLARIHTRGTVLPNGTSAKAFEAHLRSLEFEARKSGRGGWGYASRR